MDSSGCVLVSMIEGRDESKLLIRIGVWNTSLSKEHSSNWREFSNYVSVIKEAVDKGYLYHGIIFV